MYIFSDSPRSLAVLQNSVFRQKEQEKVTPPRGQYIFFMSYSPPDSDVM